MTVAENLADARAQYHLLVTGQAAAVYVDQNGERVEYRPANAARLAAYIRQLEKQIAGTNAPVSYKVTTSKGL